MAETTVTFLTYDPVTQVYSPEIRVFELEISASAQSTYLGCINELQVLIDAIVSGQASPEDLDRGMPKIADILRDLDKWTKYKSVYQGAQVISSGTIANPLLPGETIALADLGTMDRYMAENADKLIRTFRAAGYDPITRSFLTSDTSFTSIANKLFVTDASLYDVSGTLSKALGVARQSRIETNVWTQSESIQQLLMVDYVSRGNELLFDEMTKLKEAIDVNQNTLSYLNSLQDLMNQKDPEHFVMALQTLSGNVGAVDTKYSEFERLTFNQELENVAKFSDDEIETYLKSILGLDPNAAPTAAQTAGTALGAFQALSDVNLDTTLESYLAGKGITTTMASLVPLLSKYPSFDARMSSLAEDYGLSAADEELIWRTFLIKEAGLSALPSSVDLTSATTITDFEAFLASIGAQTPSSATLPAILQTNFDTFVHQRFESLLISDAKVTDLSDLDALFPSAFLSWTAVKATIETNFTAFSLTEANELSIVRAFLKIRGAALGVDPADVDMTDPANLAALATYVGGVSSSMVDPRTLLENTLISDAGVTDISQLASLYPSTFVTWPYDVDAYIVANFNGRALQGSALTTDEKLNILRAFLGAQAAMYGLQPQDIDLSDPTIQAWFNSYLGSTFTAVDNSAQLTNALSSYISVHDNSIPVYEDYSYIFPPSLDQWGATVRGQIETILNDQFSALIPPMILTDTERLNIVRAFILEFPSYTDLSIPANQTRLNTYAHNLANMYNMSHESLEVQLFYYLRTYDLIAIPQILPNKFPSSFLSWGDAKAIVENNFTAFPILNADKENIIHAFLVKEATVLGVTPEEVDITDPTVLAALTTYVQGLSIGQTEMLISKLKADAGVPDLSPLYPADLFSWDKAKFIVESAFTAFTPAETDELNIIRAFLVVQGDVLGVAPEDVDMTDPANLTALAQYAFKISSDSKALSATWLTSLPQLSITTYSDLLTGKFPDASGFTVTDRLNIWKSFLISQGLTTNDTIPTANSAMLTIFASYLDDISPVIGTSTGLRLVDALYNNLYLQKSSEKEASINSCYASLVTNNVGYPSDFHADQIKTDIANHYQASQGFTPDDWLNIWKTYLASKGISTTAQMNTSIDDPEFENTFENTISQARDFVGLTTGDALVNRFLTYYTLTSGYAKIDTVTALKPTMQSLIDENIGLPPDPTVQAAINGIIDTIFPIGDGFSISSSDRVSLWQAYMIYDGHTDPTTYTSAASVQGLSDYLETMRNIPGFVTYVGGARTIPTGSNLIDFLELYLWLPPSTGHANDPYDRAIDLLQHFFPSSSYSRTDWLNMWKAFMIKQGVFDPANTLDPFSDNFNNFLTALKAYIQPPSVVLTGDALVKAIYSYEYSIKPTDEVMHLADLSAVTTIPGVSTINYSTIVDDVVPFDLTDTQKLRIWDAFLAADAGASDSEAIIDVSSQATIDKFKTYLRSISSNDVGAAIDTRMQRIITNLQYLSNQVATAAGSSGSPLKTQLDTVRKDFEDLLKSNLPISKWVEDYQSGRVGDYQKHLNDAVVASQALNDTEREELRRVMFVYEGFYKSATAMLGRLTQLIEKMASAISR